MFLLLPDTYNYSEIQIFLTLKYKKNEENNNLQRAHENHNYFLEYFKKKNKKSVSVGACEF